MMRILATTALVGALAAQPEGVPAGFRNLLVVGDLLPPVQEALGSELIAEMLQKSPLLRANLERDGVPVGAIRTGAHLIGPFVPREVVLAMPPETVAGLATALRLLGRIAVLQFAQPDAAARDALLAAIPGDVKLLRELPLYARVRTRTPAVAQQWFDAVDAALEDLPEDGGVHVEFGADAITVSFAPADVRNWDAVAREFAWAREFADLRWSATLRLDGDLLVLTSGRNAGRLAADAMHPLWRDGGEPLAFVQADLTALLGAEDDLHQLLEDHGEALAPLLEARPELRLALDQVLSALSSLDATAAWSLRLLPDGIDWRQHSTFGEGGLDIDEPLPVDGIPAMVDPAKSVFGLANVPLDLLLIGSLQQVRDRLLRQALRRERQAGTGADMMDAADERLDRLFEYLFEDFGAAFANGAGMLAEGTVALGGIDAVGADGAGEERWLRQELQVPAIALLARIDDADDAWAFVDGFSAALGAALFGEGAGARTTEVDLRLGVPTRRVEVTLPEGRSLRLRGGLAPHWFVRDDTLVFSTSVALSTTLLARAGAAAQGVPADTFAWTHMTGANLGELLRTVVLAATALDREAGRTGAPVTDVVQELTHWCSAIAEIDSRDRLVDGEYHSRSLLRWAKGVPAPPPPPAQKGLTPVQILAEAPVDRAKYLKLPDGTFVPALNGVTNPPPMQWPPDLPFSPILGSERAADGTEWYVHADGAKSTTMMVFRSDLGRMDPTTQVANPTRK